MLEKTPESPLTARRSNQSILRGITLDTHWNAQAEALVFRSSDVKSQLIGKVPDAGKNGEQKKRASEDETAGWHHCCDGHELGKLREMVRSGRPGGLQSKGSQMVGHTWATEQVFSNCIPINTSS